MRNPIEMLRELAYEVEGPHEQRGFMRPLNGHSDAAEVLWSAADYLEHGRHFVSNNSVVVVSVCSMCGSTDEMCYPPETA